MLGIGIALGFFGLGYFCWLLFALTVDAFPFFVGVTADLAAYHCGAGPVSAILVGLIADAATVVVGQTAIAAAPSPLLRTAIAALFAAPAAIVGYHATLGLAHLGVPSDVWRETFALIGAIMVGGTAWARITRLAPPNVGQGVATAPAYLAVTSAARQV